MLPESKNIQTIADNIRSLENQIKKLDVEIPPHASTDSGKVLAVDSEGDLEWREETPYVPPAYSMEEVNTGKKWIDGKDIYKKVYTGKFPEITATQSVTITTSTLETIISFTSIIIQTNGNQVIDRYYPVITPSTGTTIFSSVTTGYSENDYIVIEEYTKPDPEPSPETKSKKGGNKK